MPKVSELIHLENNEREKATLFFAQPAAYPLYVLSQFVG